MTDFNSSHLPDDVLGIEWLPGSKLYVAFISGTANNLYKSGDGQHWKFESSLTSVADMIQIPELDDLIVGTNTRINTSYDMETWVDQTGFTSNGSDLTTLKWIPELGMIVGAGGRKIKTSTDGGVTWTDIGNVASSGHVLIDIAWAPELPMIIVSGLNGYARSVDGVTWTYHTGSALGNSVDWSPTIPLFVMVAGDGEIWTSPDGITWTGTTQDPWWDALDPAHDTPDGMEAENGYGVVWSPDYLKFVAVGGGYLDDGVFIQRSIIIETTDGVDWVTVAVDALRNGGLGRTVCYSPERRKFAAAGEGTLYNAVVWPQVPTTKLGYFKQGQWHIVPNVGV